MRRKYDNPHQGRERDRSGFLLFPKSMQGETRWLERAVWRQRYETNYADDGWTDLEWLND